MKSFNDEFWKGKKVLVTGHTGFKGSWLSEWLIGLGAEVYGLALKPNTQPSLFEQLNLENRLVHYEGNICDRVLVTNLIESIQPDIIFHLAAQALVIDSYEYPIETYETNLMGTINILNALRVLKNPCAAIFVTTDKCYENKEVLYGYREIDPLGGFDPYSSSKACAEIAINSFRQSFYKVKGKDSKQKIGIASVRAGNVIGGGDWSLNRILPDCIRSLQEGQPICIRNKYARRPWQHVLEPLGGYLLLAKKLYIEIEKEILDVPQYEKYASAFNFGPNIDSNKTVGELVEEVLKYWPGSCLDCFDPRAKHEAVLLNLSYEKAYHLLDWMPKWDFKTNISFTMDFYIKAQEFSAYDFSSFSQLLNEQITAYNELTTKNYALSI